MAMTAISSGEAELRHRVALWWGRDVPIPDGTLDKIVKDAANAKLVPSLLAWLPEGSGLTADRIRTVRRRLENATVSVLPSPPPPKPEPSPLAAPAPPAPKAKAEPASPPPPPTPPPKPKARRPFRSRSSKK